MEKKQAKKILKMAVMIYLVSFLIINWSDVSWIFNYREVSGLVSDFFNPYPSIDASTMRAYFYPNHSTEISSNNYATSARNNDQTKKIKNVKTTYTAKQNTLEVPELSLSLPIIFATSAEKSSLEKDLNLGVVYYPGSVYPGQVGQIIILGHSSPIGWPKVKYDWAFSEIDKLSIGDLIYIDLNNQQYTYVVKQKTIINRGAEVPSDSAAASSNVLTLISCWPPGKDYQRIAVTAVLQNNP
jgi:LPXTG-site transpeptidase (sortase) family protein